MIARALIALLTIGALALGAHADEETREMGAKRLFADGKVQFAAREYARAKLTFLQAYKLEPVALLLYNAAQAARRASEYDEALDLYRRYLLAAPDAPERPQCERYIADLVAYGARSPRRDPTPDEALAHPVGTEPMALVASPPPPSTAPRKKRTGLIVGVSIGAAIVIGGAVTLGLVFGLHKGPPSTDLGNYKPPQLF